jgi:hypothetical protein
MARPSPFLVLTPEELYACRSGTLSVPPEKDRFGAVRFGLESLSEVHRVKKCYVFRFSDSRTMIIKAGLLRHGKGAEKRLTELLAALHKETPTAEWDSRIAGS